MSKVKYSIPGSTPDGEYSGVTEGEAMSKSEVTREEMLEWWDDLIQAVCLNLAKPDEKDKAMIRSIRRLVEQSGEPGVMTRVSGTPIKPRVSRNDFAQACDTVWQANLEQREFDFDEMVERVMNKLGHEVEK